VNETDVMKQAEAALVEEISKFLGWKYHRCAICQTRENDMKPPRIHNLGFPELLEAVQRQIPFVGPAKMRYGIGFKLSSGYWRDIDAVPSQPAPPITG
jgi:hypothetical protein